MENKLTHTAQVQIRHAIDHLVKALIDEQNPERELQDAKVFVDNAISLAKRRG
jgi:hypothetical protein